MKGHMNMGAHISPYVHMANFQQKMMEHNGFNPIHQARVAKDFAPQNAKIKPVHQPPPAMGSPWLMMGGK